MTFEEEREDLRRFNKKLSRITGVVGLAIIFGVMLYRIYSWF